MQNIKRFPNEILKPSTYQISNDYFHMDSSPDEIIKEIPFVIRVFKNGGNQKLDGTDTVPAGADPSTGVQSKDAVILPETKLSVRIYIPKPTGKKLPLLIYFHGGGFVVGSPATRYYHNFMNLIASESKAVVVSVDYRTAPEHPVPACFDDSWEAIKWVQQHVAGDGRESWINEYADLGHVYFAGDSAGGTIAHHMAIRVGSKNPDETVNLKGIILLHPFFWGKDRIGSESDENPWKALVEEIWRFACPGTVGEDDPLINPDLDPKVSDLGCSRVLVYVAEEDIVKDRGWFYKDILRKKGWKGDIEVIEDEKKGHVYFLSTPSDDNACTMRNGIYNFMKNKE